MPNTPIVGDPKYQSINPVTLEIERGDGWQTLTKCTTETNPVLDYSTMPADSTTSQQGTGYATFRPNEGLPDYVHKSPFHWNMRAADAIRKQLAVALVVPGPCKVSEVDVPNLNKIRLFTNICDKKQSNEIRKLVTELAPDLSFETTTVWKGAIGSSGDGDVLVTHVDISKDKDFPYPYLSLWRLNLNSENVDASFGGSFLAGEIHAIRPFGHQDKTNKVFVKHLSCIECEPWVYLTILDFSKKTARSIEFTYADDHKEYDDSIEYELPGMGHSVDAKVETRIPKIGTEKADLIQTFRYTEEKKIEWWVFLCGDNDKCDYHMFNGALPEKYRSSWVSGETL